MKEVLDRIAKFYDIETELTNDIPFYIEYAQRAKGFTLEFGCETGRILIPIAELGIEVWGFDISKEMLNIAKQKN